MFTFGLSRIIIDSKAYPNPPNIPHITPMNLYELSSSVLFPVIILIRIGGFAINIIPINPTTTHMTCYLVIFSFKNIKAKIKAIAGDIMVKVSASPKGKKRMAANQNQQLTSSMNPLIRQVKLES